ncbi:MAG: hypothetical protein WCB94_00585, partial [Terriglobales bacterium]
AVLDGAGVIGDSIGITDTPCTTMAGTTPGAERFTTGAISTEEQAGAGDSTARVAELALDPTQGTDLAGTSAGAAESTTVPALLPGHLRETGRQLEDTLHPAVRAASAPAPSAATAMADRPRAIRRAEVPASVVEQPVAEEQRMAAEDLTAAGVINRSMVMFLVV